MSPFPQSLDESSRVANGFFALLDARLGLRVRAKDREGVSHSLQTRLKTLHVSSAEDYLNALKTASLDDSEWRYWLPKLTNGESYFGRDSGQFTLLRERILPELLQRRAKTRTLRVWSAGCSTGEEPYSLAILLSELVGELLPRDHWTLHILGTDINEAALAKARLGVYGAWSFRGVADAERARNFSPVAGNWQINARFREMVRFSTCNLGAQDWPSPTRGLCDMDLILCRNVLIYLNRDAVANALSRFGQTLRDGGYLFTGHAELHGHDPAPLRPRLFPESAALQRCDHERDCEAAVAINGGVNNETANVNTPNANVSNLKSSHLRSSNFSGARVTTTPKARRHDPRFPLAAPARPAKPVERETPRARETPHKSEPHESETPSETTLCDIEALLHAGRSALALQRLQPWLESASRPSPKTTSPQTSSQAWTLAASAHANLGRHDEAGRCCEQAVARNAQNANAYRVWAQIAEEQGAREQAKTLLKKVIYLAPSQFDAYLELGALYAFDGDLPRARQMRSVALQLLRALPGAGERELVRHLEELLRVAD